MKPEFIGHLLGVMVMIDRESRSIIISHQDMPPIKFSIDHPYIQGTKLERDVRAALSTLTPAICRPIEKTDGGAS